MVKLGFLRQKFDDENRCHFQILLATSEIQLTLPYVLYVLFPKKIMISARSRLNFWKTYSKQARKGFRPPSAIFVIQTFLVFFGGFFWRIFLEDFFGGIFYRNFFGGIFLEKLFWIKNFGGFLEDFLGGFFGRIFWEEFFVYIGKVIWIWKELIYLSRFWFLSRFWA